MNSIYPHETAKSPFVVHVRYTARDGGKLLGDKAVAELREKLSEEMEMVSKAK